MSLSNKPSPLHSFLVRSAVTTFEVAFNRILRLDPVAEQQALAMDRNTISLSITSLNIDVTLLFLDGQIATIAGFDPRADASLQAPAHLLVKMALFEPSSPILPGVRLSGDHELIINFHRLIKHLDVELEEPIASLIGDAAASQIGRSTRGFLNWAKKSSRSLLSAGESLVQHELPITARAHDIHQFLDSVDALYANVERLDARIARLDLAIQHQRSKPSEPLSPQPVISPTNSSQHHTNTKQSYPKSSADPC